MIAPLIAGGIALLLSVFGTASRFTFNVQAASHGAGQMRPVKSGKLLVECRVSSASR